MKTVHILSGLPGSGKSTWARNFSSQLITIVSADHYFERTGKYEFDPKLLGAAHSFCMKMFVGAVALYNHDVVIVDNTNTTALEMAPYVSVARAFDYNVEIHRFHVDPEISFKRNTHSVPMASIQNMKRNLDNLEIPPYWKVEVKTH
jgi:predicted kinase